MILPRIIPVLLLSGSGLVKTVRFQKPVYVGDPRNAVKTFNEREADESVLLDIRATPHKQPIQFDLIHEIVSEAFMPVGCGGGIQTVEEGRRLLSMGAEVILNTSAFKTPELVRQSADVFGSSSVVVCIDYRKNFWGKNEVCINSGQKGTGKDPVTFAQEMEALGAGELIINSIDRDGTMQGYDLDMLKKICRSVSVPVIACGGAGKLEDCKQAIQNAGTSAAAAGSMFVFQGKHRAVLMSYPSQSEIKKTLADI